MLLCRESLMYAVGVALLGWHGLAMTWASDEATRSVPEILPRSPMAWAWSGEGGYAAEMDAHAIAVVDVERLRIVQTWPISFAPHALTVADGVGLIVVGNAGDNRGVLSLLDQADGHVIASSASGHHPVDVAVLPGSSTCYVVDQYGRALIAADVKTGRVLATIPVARDPYAVAISPSLSCVVVIHLLPEGRADRDDAAVAVTLVDTRTNQVVSVIPLTRGATCAHGVCISPDGRFAYVTHLVGKYWQAATQLEMGWMNVNAMSVIDLSARQLVASLPLDDVDRGAANPWGIACSPDGTRLAIAHAGSHEISFIDRAGLHRIIAERALPPRTLAPLGVLQSCRTRVPAGGLGPRAVSARDSGFVSLDYFSDTVSVYSGSEAAGGGKVGPAHIVHLQSESACSPARRGELAFNDARTCFQTWQSCASCHPDGGRMDGLNWDLLNDGLGNPKNTKSLLFAPQMKPVMWLGVRDNCATAIRSGYKYIQFATVGEDVRDPVLRYLESLRPVASPHLVDGRLNPRAERGRAIFEAAGCAHCHSGALFTDQRSYDLGATSGIDKGRPVVVPSLIEAWRTAPYLHDGSAATIRDVLAPGGTHKRHGNLSEISDAALDDLCEYVLSL